jgi:hypothetical protein
VGNAQLNAGGREHGADRFGKSGRPVHAGNGDVFRSAAPKIGEYPHPKLPSLIFAYPQP